MTCAWLCVVLERAVIERDEAKQRIAARKAEVARRAALGEHCLESCVVDYDVADAEWVGCSACGVFIHDKCVTNVPPAQLAELKGSRAVYYCVDCEAIDSRKRRKR